MKKLTWYLIIPVIAVLSMAIWQGYERLGHTPGELMDYADHRLSGHPKLEALAGPILVTARQWLAEPSLQERQSQAFVVPPPPPRFKFGAEPAIVEQTSAPGAHQVLRVGPHEAIRSISVAAGLAKDGDIVEIVAGEYHGDVALWLQKKLTIRGIGGNARLFADGRASEGKAIWVIRDGDFDVSNIDFVGAKVSDKNGAGIRFESGRLRLTNCLFWGNQDGLLTAGSHDAELTIVNSEFGYNGAGDGQSHDLYVGQIAWLRVTGSYFHHANVGHLLKSRARNNEILYNRLTDESGGRASYELEFPNGGSALVIGNIIQQGRQTENSNMIAYGLEGYVWPANQLYLASNTLVNDHPYGGAFLRVAPNPQSVITINNLLIGEGQYHAAKNVVSSNDIHGEWGLFVQASRYDYRLSNDGQKLAFESPQSQDRTVPSLTPVRQYIHPRQTKFLVAPVRYPGALQPE